MSRLIFPKAPHEVQIHVAVTLVGDRLSVKPEERVDQEVGQWAVRYMKNDFGKIRVQDLEKSFTEFYAIVLKRFRELGVLRSGE